MNYLLTYRFAKLSWYRLCRVRVIKDNGEFFHDDVAAGLDDAVSLGYARHIVNMSLGFCVSDPLLLEAVRRTANAGILMIAGAGNTGWCSGDPVMYPARYDEVIAVSGTTEDDTFWQAPRYPCGSALGSSSGPQVEISAPFWDSTMAGTGQYYWDCGTSYSSAKVTGVAALAWTKYPTFTAAQLRTHLQASVVDRGPAGRDSKFGYGRIDAAKAVGWPPPPPPPPFSVTITGPTEIEASLGCGWYASVSQGAAPYSYVWTVNGQPAGSNEPELWYQNDGTSFTLSVTVTDANGLVATDDHSVSINPGAGCF